MKRISKIIIRGREQILSEKDFPLTIGGENTSRIGVPELKADEQVALISFAEGVPLVSVISDQLPVRCNGRVIDGAHWLYHDDILSVGSIAVWVRVTENEILFQVETADAISSEPSPDAPFSRQPAGPAAAAHDQKVAPIGRKVSLRQWLIPYLIGFSLTILVAMVWFVFTARQVYINIDPTPDTISVQGGLFSPQIGPYYLLQPGNYQLKAAKTCFLDLAQTLQINDAKRQVVDLKMEKQPGRLSVNVHPEGQAAVGIEGAKVLIAAREIGVTPLEDAQVQAGPQELSVLSEAYLPLRIPLEIQGCLEKQVLNLALIPAWSEISFSSNPPGAAIHINGEPKGQTPQTLKLLAGTYDLELHAERYKIWKARREIPPNQPQEIGPVTLVEADGILRLRTDPTGVGVTVGDKYMGLSPLEISLRPGRVHTIRLAKAGFQKVERRLKVTAAEQKTLGLKLKPSLGIIKLNVLPRDAELFVDGKSKGVISQIPKKQVKLNATLHRIDIRKKGYQTFNTSIVPRPGFPQELEVRLTKLQAPAQKTPGIIQASNRYPMVLVIPKDFTMGSSRREQGRRSNETLRRVLLKRAFYIGVREVTNQEFRKFMPEHQSGTVGQQSLNLDKHPVVNISWQQAAQYCNWLSRRESLPPAYRSLNGKLVPVSPIGIGYRLPTEAEWEYCARYNTPQAALKYPWGAKFPPVGKAGNYADVSAKGLVNSYLKNYNDGYAITAPVASFKFNRLGLHDLGGNAAEWSHDFYTIYPYHSGKVYIDPIGPQEGKHHVIRGGSWKQASISTLRTAYRDYGMEPRPDVGFRVGRYAKTEKSSGK